MIVFLNGHFIDERQARISPFDHGFYYGDGVYETLRTVRGEIWQPKKHLRRLFRSAELIGLRLSWTDEEILRWTEEVITKNGLGLFGKVPFVTAGTTDQGHISEARVRITVTRGMMDVPTILIRAEVLKEVPEELLKKGVKVGTMPMERFMPKVKSLHMLPFVLAQQKAKKDEVYEILYVNRDGFVTEGSITNYFIVQKGVLITPDENILYGTTREHVLEIVKSEGIPVEFKNLRLEDIFAADECFICNAPRGIVPVREVDGIKIGKGDFELAKKLQEGFYDR